MHAFEYSYKVFCLIGDGESAEGSIWEAIHFSSFYHLDNLVAVVDVNRLGQSQATSLAHDMETYQDRFRSFGWVFVWESISCHYVYFSLDVFGAIWIII